MFFQGLKSVPPPLKHFKAPVLFVGGCVQYSQPCQATKKKQQFLSAEVTSDRSPAGVPSKAPVESQLWQRLTFRKSQAVVGDSGCLVISIHFLLDEENHPLETIIYEYEFIYIPAIITS